VSLPRDDNGQFRTQLTEDDLHQRNNEIITLDMLKYNDRNKVTISVIKNNTIIDENVNLDYIENLPSEDNITEAEYTYEDTHQDVVEIVPAEA
jgi:translation elongation factor EF-Ts